MKDEKLNTGEGYLLVKVSTGFGAIPIENATVTVYNNSDERNDILFVLPTDNVGLTERIALPAPNRYFAMSPNNIKPYSTYSLVVSADGFYTKENSYVNIFDTITAIDSINLVPILESDMYDFEV